MFSLVFSANGQISATPSANRALHLKSLEYRNQMDGPVMPRPETSIKLISREGRLLPHVVAEQQEIILSFEFANHDSTRAIVGLVVEPIIDPASELTVSCQDGNFQPYGVRQVTVFDKRTTNHPQKLYNSRLQSQPLNAGETLKGRFGLCINRVSKHAPIAGEVRGIPGELKLISIEIHAHFVLQDADASQQYDTAPYRTERIMIYCPIPLIARMRHATKDEILVFWGAVLVSWLLSAVFPTPKDLLDAVIRWLQMFPLSAMS